MINTSLSVIPNLLQTTRPMNSQLDFSPAPTRWRRVLTFPLVQILVAFLFVAISFAVVSTPINLFVTDKTLKRVGALLLAAVAIGSYTAYVRVMEKRTVTELSTRGAALELGTGLALGVVLFSVTIGILAGLGVYQVTGQNGWQSMLAFLPVCIFAGFFEEILIRGILFRILEQWLGSWSALAISAIIFGALHLFNPGATVFAGAAIAIEAGVLLAAAYMLTRRLWLCIGTHIAWNFTQGGIYSVAVSGGEGKGLLQSKLVGPEYLTGGAFGAEASVVALVVCLAAGIGLLVMAIRKGHVISPPWARKVV
jgi:membrane protease YdiL (CAAX protease family)